MTEKSRNKSMIAIDMTTGSPLRHILIFALPLFIGNIFQQIYSMVDTMVAGYALGDQAIAAIGATSSLYGLLIDFASGLNSGCAIVVTQCFGAHDGRKLRKSIAGMIIIDAIITCLVTISALIFLRPLMCFMNTPDSIFEQAYIYIAIICAGMLFTISYNMFSAILRAVGNSKTSLYFLIISSVLNMGLDFFFVVVLGISITGIALATVIAELVSALLCGIYVYRRYKSILPCKDDFKVSSDIIRELFSSGIAMALMYCVVDLGSVIFQRANNHLGETIISAHTAARRIIEMMMQPLATIATASSTFIGQNWGAKKKERIHTAIWKVLFLEIIWSLLGCAAIWAFGKFIVQLTIGTDNSDIISNAVMSLRWHLSFFPVLGCLLVLRTAMQAMGKKSIPIASSCIELGMKLLSAAFVIPNLGFLGTCITEPITWSLMLLLLAIAYFKYSLTK